jgi:hypothetical protein
MEPVGGGAENLSTQGRMGLGTACKEGAYSSVVG